MNRKKKAILIIFLLLFVFLLFWGFTFFKPLKNQKKQEVTFQAPSYLTYQNKEIGLYFNYPLGFQVIERIYPENKGVLGEPSFVIGIKKQDGNIELILIEGYKDKKAVKKLFGVVKVLESKEKGYVYVIKKVKPGPDTDFLFNFLSKSVKIR